MKREWNAILGRYGRDVTVQTAGQEDVTVKAFLQPVLDKGAQLAPSPLGLRLEEQAVYLGPGDVALVPGETVVRTEQAAYEVRSARIVDHGHHAWAMLQRMEGENELGK